MKWMEIIEVQTSENQLNELVSKFQNLIKEVNDSKNDKEISIYTSSVFKNDIGIHIHHISKGEEISGSKLGLYLKAELRSYGLVNHSIWIEKVINN